MLNLNIIKTSPMPSELTSVWKESDQKHLKQSKSDKLKEFNSDSFFWRPTTSHYLNDSTLKFEKHYLNGPGPGKYGRLSSLGHLNHDPTIPRRPAYTIPRAERSTIFKDDIFYWSPGTGELAIRPNSSKNRTACNGPGPGKYSRPSSIGHLNNDVTLKSTPAYSIGKAERGLNFTFTPFYARPKSTPNTPGPGAYAYEKHPNSIKSSIPAFTISKASRFPTIIA